MMNNVGESLPTVARKSVFLTSIIAAKEKRIVPTIGIPGAFTQADMDELIHLRLEDISC
jgi:hypothetical protein